MSLSKRTVVQCNKSRHTCFRMVNTMNSNPTLIVVADMTPPSAEGGTALSTLAQTLRVGLESELPIVLVAPPDAAQFARATLPGNAIVELNDIGTGAVSRSDCLARAVAAGVLASPHAPGWLIWPGDMADVMPQTLKELAQSVTRYPMVFPQYKQQRGHPVGLSSEFFSELIRLQSGRDLGRLMTRYPALGIDVDDPGILESVAAPEGLETLRSRLQGIPAGAPATPAMVLV